MQIYINIYTEILLLSQIFYNIFSIDATNETSYGKFVNDSPVYVNAVMKRERVSNSVVLCLYATQKIASGTEIR